MEMQCCPWLLSTDSALSLDERSLNATEFGLRMKRCDTYFNEKYIDYKVIIYNDTVHIYKNALLQK